MLSLWPSTSWSKKDEESLLRDWSTTALPWPIYNLGLYLFRFLFWFQNNVMPASLALVNMSFTGFCLSEVIRTLAALDVAEALSRGPMTADELAKELGCDSDRLFRILRAATVHGVFDEIRVRGRPIKFRNNKLSATLRADHPNTQKYFVLACTGKEFAGAWGQLEWGVRTGGDIWRHGNPGEATSFWHMIRLDPRKEDIFSRAMTGTENFSKSAIMKDFAWGKFSRLVDIGGAYGSVLASLMGQYPRISAVLFDQEKVIERAKLDWRQNPARESLLPRITFTHGDFFRAETLPKPEGSRNAYVMRQILHDWDDQDCVRILRSLREVIGDSDCTLCIVEAIPLASAKPTGDPFNRPRVLSDVHMMVQLNARERELDHFKDLLRKSGFRFVRLTPTRSLFSVLEAAPVAFSFDRSGEEIIKELPGDANAPLLAAAS